MKMHVFEIRPLEKSPLEKCIIAKKGSIHRLLHPAQARYVASFDDKCICVDNGVTRLAGKIEIVGFDGSSFLVRAVRQRKFCQNLLEIVRLNDKTYPAKGIYSIEALDFCDAVSLCVKFFDSPFLGEDMT